MAFRPSLPALVTTELQRSHKIIIQRPEGISVYEH